MRITVGARLKVEEIPDAIARTAVDDLTVANPQHVTLQRIGKWISPDLPETLTLAEQYGDSLILPRGYLETLLRRAKSMDVPCELIDARLKLPAIDIKLTGELRSYQAEALEAMKKHGSGIVVAPCGSGKTVLGMALVAHWQQPSLILVHTKELLEQTCAAVREWLGIEPGVIGGGTWEPKDITVALVAHWQQPSLILVHTKELLEQTRAAVQEWLGIEPGVIGGGTWEPKDVTVALVQSLTSRGTDDLTGRFGLVLLDEAHHCPAATFMSIMQSFPAAFKHGLTATPQRADGLEKFMEAVIGPIRYQITHEDLKAAGVLVVPEVQWVRSDFYCHPDLEWRELIDALTGDEKRNDLLLGVALRALDEGRRIIALSERVKHVELLTERVNQFRPGSAALVTGSMPKKRRTEAMQQVRDGQAQILFSTRLADEGLNVPDLDTLVLLTPSRNAGRTIQRVGRILRAVPDKPQPVIIDIVDPLVQKLRYGARSRFFESYRTLAPDCRLPEWLERRWKAA